MLRDDVIGLPYSWQLILTRSIRDWNGVLIVVTYHSRWTPRSVLSLRLWSPFTAQPGQRSVVSCIYQHGHTGSSWAAFLVHERQQAVGWRSMEVGSVPRLGCSPYRPDPFAQSYFRASIIQGTRRGQRGIFIDVGWREEYAQVFQLFFGHRLLSMRHWDIHGAGRAYSGTVLVTKIGRLMFSSCDTRPKVHHGQPEYRSTLDVDELARLYDNEITRIARGMIPMWTVRFKRRPSDSWFDDDSRVAKRIVGRLITTRQAGRQAAVY